MNKQKKQMMLLNKLLSEDVPDIREALTALCGFAIAKKEWAVLTINKAIFMLEYIAAVYDSDETTAEYIAEVYGTNEAIENKELDTVFILDLEYSLKDYYTDEAIANKEMNHFFVLKNAEYKQLLFSQSNIGNQNDYPTRNTIYNANSWLEHFKGLMEYPKAMLGNFALKQEVILACSGKTEEVKQCLQNSTDEKLAARLFELFRGQMEVQALYNGVNQKTDVCRRCGGKTFYKYKHSMLCEECGKLISNRPIFHWVEAVCGIGFCALSVSSFQSSDDRFGGFFFLALGIVAVVPLLSALVRKLQGMSILADYREKNRKFNLCELHLLEIARDKLS